jgi:hypothetical protein
MTLCIAKVTVNKKGSDHLFCLYHSDMRTRPLLGIVAIATSIFILTGCTSGSPEPTPKPTISKTATPTPKPSATSTPTPTPTKAPVTPPKPVVYNTTIIIGADSLIVEKGQNVQKFSYDEAPASAIAAVTNTTGIEPESTYSGEDDYCWYQMTTINWGELRLNFSKQDAATSEYWNVATNNDDGDPLVSVMSPRGYKPGDLMSVVISNHPEILHESSEYEGTSYEIALDEQSLLYPTTPDGAYDGKQYDASGTILSGTNDVIGSVSARQGLYGDC